MILRSVILPFVVAGMGVMLERGNDGGSQSSRLPIAYSIGARREALEARLEYASFRTSDGNQTLSVSRDYQNWLAWMSYEFAGEEGWHPYVAGALGIGRTSAETRFSSQPSELNRAAWSGVFATAAGLRGEWSSHISVRPELRYESAEGFKTKDARWGAFVQLEYRF